MSLLRIPQIRGVIERRILVNYRVDPDALARLLPPPFEPKLQRGKGLVGICLIRLRGVRPRLVPEWLGIRSENAAHRAAVLWQAGGARHEGVYIRRRDTDSRLNAWAGGRLFPGEHHHARFTVAESCDKLSVDVLSDDGETRIAVKARLTKSWPVDSVFETCEQASQFFAHGSLGYSATHDSRTFQGLELRCLSWHAEALAIDEVRSSYFDDPNTFPPGSIQFDNALLMRDIEHEWVGREDLCCAASRGRVCVENTPVAHAPGSPTDDPLPVPGLATPCSAASS